MGSDVNILDKQGHSPLHDAATFGKTSTAEVLLEYGAAIDSNIETGYTPLICAILHGQVTSARLLIEHGAHVNYHSFQALGLGAHAYSSLGRPSSGQSGLGAATNAYPKHVSPLRHIVKHMPELAESSSSTDSLPSKMRTSGATKMKRISSSQAGRGPTLPMATASPTTAPRIA